MKFLLIGEMEGVNDEGRGWRLPIQEWFEDDDRTRVIERAREFVRRLFKKHAEDSAFKLRVELRRTILLWEAHEETEQGGIEILEIGEEPSLRLVEHRVYN